MRDMRILNRRKNGMVDHGEQGMVTSEIAMGLMVLSLVIILMLGVIRAGIEYGNVQEQSREIAVQLARGKSPAQARSGIPPHVHVEYEDNGTFVTVRVRSRIQLPFPVNISGSTQVEKEGLSEKGG
ncbi:hypothetical protein R6G85_04595 [Actinotignum urinale]|uniref:Pilus assembly protein n=1 Tax=Actinotignum urinale TaxID=190146 RepID=A0AAW9HRM1_9ACTO|nr:hypothetical protein [Actinotignum urinale]MDY5129362.1 hypothetical protein [Actinotignum urinale]MDY5133750.1 hypothetical protein [Actinotignum urinale]MDY5151764.1 hypothetical protein [Actinotignum urinale]MDY5154348.1 hypothetical protein [Actinotignum urinale]WIK59752.1 hypothetical protein CJ184_003720 [Actinotignum urinale]